MMTNESYKEEIAKELRQVQKKLAELDAPGRNYTTNLPANHALPIDTPKTYVNVRTEANDHIWDLLRYC
ncbi:MAG: hypothetical protein J0652_08270 [Desulfobulbaceae bacterium]|jgi:hypothetical protein|nr:hypothetical protein [Desulfobulbaceae bacterium]